MTKNPTENLYLLYTLLYNLRAREEKAGAQSFLHVGFLCFIEEIIPHHPSGIPSATDLWPGGRRGRNSLPSQNHTGRRSPASRGL